jgi:hypothetical protein
MIVKQLKFMEKKNKEKKSDYFPPEISVLAETCWNDRKASNVLKFDLSRGGVK